YKVSNPHNSTAQYWTEARFDGLERQIKVIAPDSSPSQYTYTTNSVVTTDPTGKARKAQFDGVGRLSAIYEPDSTTQHGLTFATSYAYTVLDALTTVTQGPDQTRNYAYDNLGRLTSVKTPETNQTAYVYQYNDFDLVTQRTDPRGVITTYGYDSI